MQSRPRTKASKKRLQRIKDGRRLSKKYHTKSPIGDLSKR
jgi:hypothetical protein